MSGIKFTNFSGARSDNVIKWKTETHRNFEFLEWDNTMRARFIPTILHDKALQFYENLDPSIKCDYTKVLEALEFEFTNKQRSVFHYNALLNRKQLATESIEHFAQCLNSLFETLQIRQENLKIAIFLRGLQSNEL